jgi:leucine dehydrogenase
VSTGPGGLTLVEALGHREVRLYHDAASGLRAVVAIHDTTLGPAVGGTRMRVYPSLDAAVTDALRLSRAMTAKAAMAEMPYGGGKAVILGDPARDKTEALLTAYAGVLRDLQDRFWSGCDLGLDVRDVAFLARLAPNISDASGGASLDTAGLAALGVFASIEAAAARLSVPLAALHVAVQGVGAVGGALARRLRAAGTRLTLADLDDARVRALAAETGAGVVPPSEIDAVAADVFSPNAAGGVLDDRTVARLRCRAVVGGANEQLQESRHGDALHARGILYAPDYVVNAGGLLSLLFETGRCDEAEVTARVRAIGPRLASLWREADETGRPPHRVADERVAARLAAARGRAR